MIYQTANTVSLAFSHPLDPNWIEHFSAPTFMGAIQKQIESQETQGSNMSWDIRKELCKGISFT